MLYETFLFTVPYTTNYFYFGSRLKYTIFI